MEPTPIDSPRAGFVGWWNRTPLYARIIGGMVLGVAVGLLLGPKAEALAIPSKLVLRLLGALAPALILMAIVQALMTAKFAKGTAGRLIRLLLLNTLVAIAIGLLVANVIRPGHWSSVPAAPQDPAHATKPRADILQQFLENVPQSLFGPLADNGKVIGVILIAVALGLALRQLAATRSVAPVPDLVDIAMAVFVRMLHWIVAVLPLAVFGIVASLIGTKGFAAFQALGGFVIAVLCALLLQAIYYLARVRFGSWVRPGDLLRGTRDALVMAFSTGSSTATMPVTYECLRERVGVREKSASLGALVGANFNNDGTALYEAMSALFVSQILTHSGVGAPLDLGQQLLVVLTSVIASVGAAGIPEAGLVTMTLVFSAVNLPLEYIAILLPV
ncbi:MAG TPA: dicarboxylate/amino acid:cation symporter, partial [Chthoniobacteraceae bacterium]|nr:dicarboxylate/amino acid:cation symporter [Chthoniobacteraceae bacterium]